LKVVDVLSATSFSTKLIADGDAAVRYTLVQANDRLCNFTVRTKPNQRTMLVECADDIATSYSVCSIGRMALI